MASVLEIWFDGACHNAKGKLTPMGVGLVVKMDGDIIEELAYAPPMLGTSNVAEWIGCYLALTRTIEFHRRYNIYSVEIFSDSLLIVSQMNGEFAVRSENLLPYYEKCLLLFNKIKKFSSITHVRREFNKEADVQSKIGLKNSLYHLN
jgi:ribonuclease HI